MKKPFYEDLPTEQTDISVHVTWTIKDEKSDIVLRAYPIYKGGIPVDGYKPLKRVAHSKEEISMVKDQLKNSFMQKMKGVSKSENTSGKRNEKLDENLPMVKAYRILEKSEMLDPQWSSHTKEDHLTYFERNVLPVIQSCENPSDFGQKEQQQLKDFLTEKNLNHGNSLGYLDNAVGATNSRFQQAITIYECMRTIDPFLPDIKILRDIKSIRTQSEQPKSLPLPIVIGLRAEIETLLNDNPKLARAAAIMHSGGPRTSESAAVIQSDMVCNDGFVLIKIDYQESEGKRIPSLKRDASHRRVVLDEWGSNLVLRANKIIGPETDTDIAPLTSKELSGWIKSTLNKLGYGEEYWNSAIKDMSRNGETDRSGAPSTDVAAYILRRDAESRWANICGLSKEEQDIMLGHKRNTKGKKRLRLTDPEVYKTIAMKIKRFNPGNESNDVSYTKELSREASGSLIPFREYNLVNASFESIKLTVVMKIAEPGEFITVQTEGQLQKPRIIPGIGPCVRENTECIGGDIEF